MSVEFEDQTPDTFSYKTVDVHFDHTTHAPFMVRSIMKLGIKKQAHANYLLLGVVVLFLAATFFIISSNYFPNLFNATPQVQEIEMYPKPASTIKVPDYKPH